MHKKHIQSLLILVVLSITSLSGCDRRFAESQLNEFKFSNAEKAPQRQENTRLDNDFFRKELNRLIESRNLDGLIQLMNSLQEKKDFADVYLLADICSAYNSYDFKDHKQFLYARNCSKNLLSNNNEVPISLEQRMIENLQGVEEYKASLVSEENWEADRAERIKLLLHLWRRLQNNIDRNFDPANVENKPISNVPVPGPYKQGVNPDNIREPEIRAKYKESIKANTLKAKKYNMQVQLKKLDKTLPEFVESFLIQMYSAFPSDLNKLKKDIDTFNLEGNRSERVIKEVIQNQDKEN